MILHDDDKLNKHEPSEGATTCFHLFTNTNYTNKTRIQSEICTGQLLSRGSILNCSFIQLSEVDIFIVFHQLVEQELHRKVHKNNLWMVLLLAEQNASSASTYNAKPL